MTTSLNETQRKSFRMAGLLYLLMAISAPIGLVYVPGKLIVSGDATKTADLITQLFRKPQHYRNI